MALADDINARIAELEGRISRINQGAAEQVAALEKKIALLRQVNSAVTPQLEGLLDALKKEGFLS